MVTHTPLYRELYKFTNEYKENEAKKIINKFIFKQPSVEIADGSNFINSEILYSSKLDIIHNTRVYFFKPLSVLYRFNLTKFSGFL